MDAGIRLPGGEVRADGTYHRQGQGVQRVGAVQGDVSDTAAQVEENVVGLAHCFSLAVKQRLRLYAKHRWRPGARPRDPLESARGSALPDLHPFPPPIDRPGQWVPAPSAGTTAIVVARKRLADTTCARTAEIGRAHV